jgi:hypothetical protein
VLYDSVRAWLTSSSGAAQRHAVQVRSAERRVGLAFEQPLQRAAVRIPWLVVGSNVVYSVTHLLVPILLLVLLYRRAPAAYRYWCGVFVVILGLGLVCFWLYPLMPPRLLPAHFGYTDTANHFLTVTREPLRHALGNTSTPSPGSWAANNPYAAMPSLHVGWAIWAMLAGWSVVRSRVGRILLVAYLPVMVLSVLVTGNHWTLDAIGAAAVVGTAMALTAIAQRIARRAAGSGLVVQALPAWFDARMIEVEPAVRVA